MATEQSVCHRRGDHCQPVEARADNPWFDLQSLDSIATGRPAQASDQTPPPAAVAIASPQRPGTTGRDDHGDAQQVFNAQIGDLLRLMRLLGLGGRRIWPLADWTDCALACCDGGH